MNNSPLALKPLTQKNAFVLERHQAAYRSTLFITIIAFLAGLGLMVHVRIGVRVSTTELLSPLIFISLSRGLRGVMENRTIRNSIFFLCLYIFAVVVSDYLCDVPMIEHVKGLARPVLILWMLINFGLIIFQGTKYILPICIGFVFGSILHLLFNTAKDEYDFSLTSMEYAYFVFRVTPFVTSAAAVASYFSWRLKSPSIAIFCLLVGMAVTVVSAGRASVFSWFVGIMAVFIAVYRANPNWYAVLRPTQSMIQTFFAVTILSLTSYYVYKSLAVYGVIGRGVKAAGNLKQLENDVGWGPIGLLINGRPDAISSIFMILDSPLYGHGTTSQSGAYLLRAMKLTNQIPTALDVAAILNGRRSGGHSIIWGQWASNGILTVPFWLYVLMQIGRLATMLVLAKDSYIALLAMIFTGMIWEIFFSPCSVLMRSYAPLILVFAAFYIPELQKTAYGKLFPRQRPAGNMEHVPLVQKPTRQFRNPWPERVGNPRPKIR